MDAILKAKLKRLVQNGDWEVIYAFKAFMIELWNKQEIKRDDQFNTVWEVAKRDGKIEGLNEFINSVEKIALDTE
jgi:hypothetical protein